VSEPGVTPGQGFFAGDRSPCGSPESTPVSREYVKILFATFPLVKRIKNTNLITFNINLMIITI
jgi:hypothetical protein